MGVTILPPKKEPYLAQAMKGMSEGGIKGYETGMNEQYRQQQAATQKQQWGAGHQLDTDKFEYKKIKDRADTMTSMLELFPAEVAAQMIKDPEVIKIYNDAGQQVPKGLSKDTAGKPSYAQSGKLSAMKDQIKAGQFSYSEYGKAQPQPVETIEEAIPFINEAGIPLKSVEQELKEKFGVKAWKKVTGETKYIKGKTYEDPVTKKKLKFLGGDPNNERNWQEIR